MKEEKKQPIPGEIRDPHPGDVRGISGNWPMPDRSIAESYADVLRTVAYYGQTRGPKGYYDSRMDEVREGEYEF